MTTAVSHPRVESYLTELRRHARALPRLEREELLEQIEEHLREAIPPSASDTEVRNALARLGDPRAIVVDECERLGVERPRRGILEWLVVIGLPVGSLILPGIGWLIAVILLWGSKVWTVREKLIGTLMPPGVWGSCSSWLWSPAPLRAASAQPPG